MKMKIKTAFGGLILVLLLFAGFSIPAAAQATLPIPAGLAPGDQYRLVFWTSQTTVATSTDIAYYNNFVMNAANGPSSRVAYLNATWKVIGSTATVDARDNTGTNPYVYGAGVPIYNLDGTKVADDYWDLWDGSIDSGTTYGGIKFNEFLQGGFNLSGLPVWTGSFQDGTRGANNLFVTYPLGSSQPFYGYNDFPTERWVYALPGLPTDSLPLYAMSGEFTVPGSGPTANAGGPYSGDFGSDIVLIGATASDPDMDTLTYAWTVNSASCSFNNASVLNPNLTCNATGNLTATLEVSDGVNPSVSRDAAVTVNKAETTTTVTCPAGPYTYTGAAQTPCSASVTGPGGLSETPVPVYSNNTNAGTASASYTYDESANYLGSNDSQDFTIGQATSSVTVTCTTGAPFTYTGSAQTPCTASASGVGMTDVNVTASLVYGSNTDAGSATADADWSGDANHTGDTGSGGFSIGKASSTVTVTCTTGAPFTYTGSAQTPCTASYSGAGGLSGSLTVSYTDNTIAGTAGASASYDGDANHNGSSGSGSFAIGLKSATWTTNNNSKIFGSSDPIPLTTGSGSGFIPTDGVTATYSRVAGGTVGTYPITATLTPTGAMSNYSITNAGATFTIGAWTLKGFYPPVGVLNTYHLLIPPMSGIVWNSIKGGQTVPLKFNIFAGATEQTNVSAVAGFTVQQVACVDVGTTLDDVDFVTSGATTLRYDGTPGSGGQFIQNWKTPSGANLCYRTVMTATDGSVLVAFFKTKK